MIKIKEIWKDIKGYEGLYQISNFGNVKSLARRVNCGDNKTRLKQERILKNTLDNHGYLTTSLCDNRKKEKYLIHRLVAEVFIPNPNNLPQVNHIDENKTNNNVENLEWCTQQYNSTYGEFIAEHESILAAARATGFDYSGIHGSCIGKYRTYSGYIFKLKSNEILQEVG